MTRWLRCRKRHNRQLHLIAESNVYDPQLVRSVADEGHGWDALWCDDFLHSVFAILRPGDQMSARPYHPHVDLDATLRRGFVYQGTLREARRRLSLDETQGVPPVPLDSLIYAIQNHDFIGNHPQGRRLHQLTSPDAQKAAAALLLLHPAIPMLFMGEEFAAEHPFFFFVDFGDQHLREAVEQGRRQEHPQHDWTDVASPLSDEAFERSKIGSTADGDPSMRAWYRRLIAQRREWKAAGILSPQTLVARWDAGGHYAASEVPHRHGGVVCDRPIAPGSRVSTTVEVARCKTTCLAKPLRSGEREQGRHLAVGRPCRRCGGRSD